VPNTYDRMKTGTYALVTGAYWAFTLTDGALRMLVLLYFHDLGYNPVSLALLFVLYELFGVFTNLIGGWLGARSGLHRTLVAGLGLQVLALLALSLHSPSWREWLAVTWVMGAQALSGIAKDLTKMSSKTAVKFVSTEGTLFRFVALLTGSKNALKGGGFFLGAALLTWRGFDQSLWIMAAALTAVLALTVVLVSPIGHAGAKPPFRQVAQKSRAIKRLSLARFFLFGSRDIWFVVALPVFLGDELGWSFYAIGAFLAIWVMAYGAVQAIAPALTGVFYDTRSAASGLLTPMAVVMAVIAIATSTHQMQALATVMGLIVFGAMFAITSSVHSYLILAYSESDDETALDVGYYYSANAAGRLVGTILSGLLTLLGGFPAALVGAIAFLIAALLVSSRLPEVKRRRVAMS